MTRRWLRLDAQWDDTEWVMLLGPHSQLAWIKLLCYVKRDGRQGRAQALTSKAAAKKWDIPVRAVDDMITAAVKDGALCVVADEGGSSKWEVTKWRKYQEVDPTAAKRKRAQRAREREAPESEHTTKDDVTEVTRDVTESRRDTVARDHRPPTTPSGETASSAHADGGEAPGESVEKEPPPEPSWGEIAMAVRTELRADPAETERSCSIVKAFLRSGVPAQDLIDVCRGARKLVDEELVPGMEPGQPIGFRMIRPGIDEHGKRKGWQMQNGRWLWDAAIDRERHGPAPAPPSTAKRTRTAPQRLEVRS